MCLVFIVIFFSYLCCIILFIYGWDALKESELIHTDLPEVTVIVAARNEEKNIDNCLASICSQNYPLDKLQIIVVDDFSEDNTLNLMRNYSPVTILELRDFIEEQGVRSGKKMAIQYAIHQAKGKYVLITDADCIVPKNWVLSTVSCFVNQQADVITGPICIAKPKSFFEQLQSLDMWAYIALSASAIGLKKPILANGANFAFKKEWFYKVNGYEGSEHISSGDDVFLLHKFLRSGAKTTFNKSTDALVETMPMDSLLSFMIQRIRWASKTAAYRNVATLLIIAIIMLSYLAVPVLIVWSALYPIAIKWLVGMLLMKFFIDFIYLHRVLNFFKQGYLLQLFLPAQLFHIMYVLMVGAVALFIPLKWKGRKLYR
jgi:cellulose synthase/poly-beta-1,6-N-acetylglucosamine synthase-like glycosyltransferase